MKRLSTRLGRSGVAFGTIALIASLTGCADTATADVTPTTTTTATSSPAAEGSITDGDSCAAFDDVLTIVQNAGMGLKSGRMDQSEYDGWLQLATRILDRVPTRGDGAVTDAINALKKIAPPVSDFSGGATGIDTREWNTVPVGAACQAAGAPLTVTSFTGG